MSSGLDTNMDQLEARARNISAQLTIYSNIKQALAQDQSVDSIRESTKATLAQAHTDALALDGEGLAGGDRDLFIAQVAGVRDSLS